MMKGIRRKGGKTRRTLPKKKVTMKVTKTISVPKLKDTTRAGVLEVVRRLMNKETENKFVGWKLEQSVIHNSPIGAADAVSVVQQIPQGVTAQSRLGDKIRPKSLVVRGIISFNNDQPSNTSQNLLVRVCVLAQKNIKVGSAIAGGIDANRLLRPGYLGAGADQIPYSGNTIDTLAPINTDLFRVYMDKVFTMTPQVVTAGAREQWDNTVRWAYAFNQLPSSFSYDEGNGDWANNFAPFVVIGYAYSDGSIPDTLQSRLVTNTSSFLSYEDA